MANLCRKQNSPMYKITIPLALVAITIGCSKPDPETTLNELQQNQSIFNGILSGRSATEQGRQYFSSVEALQDYYNRLAQEIDHATEEEEAMIFETAEQGYTSLREAMYSEELDRIPNDEEILNRQDFIEDDIRKSILNEHSEIQIGDRVYVYYAEDQIYSIPKEDTETIQKFRDLEKTANGPVPIDILTNDVELRSYSASYGISKPQTLVTEPGTGKYPKAQYHKVTYSAQAWSNNVHCQVFSKNFYVQLTGIKKTFDNMNTATTSDDTLVRSKVVNPTFTAEIDFGDGVIQNFGTLGITRSPIGINPTHVYASEGTYTPVVTVRFSNYLGATVTSTVRLNPIVVSTSCTQRNLSKVLWRDAGTNRSLRACIWFKTDLFGNHAGSESKSYEWSNRRNRWKRKRTQLFTEINATFRNNSCQITAQESANRDCNNCFARRKKCSVRGVARRDISNGDINSHHKLVDGSTIITLDLVLNPCQ